MDGNYAVPWNTFFIRLPRRDVSGVFLGNKELVMRKTRDRARTYIVIRKGTSFVGSFELARIAPGVV